MSKQRFIGPVFVEFRKALKDNDLKSARRLKQELANLYRKKPKLPPFHRAAEMLYDTKAGKETESITEARYLAKLPDLYAEIAQSVIETFESFNYPDELIEYLDDVHKRFNKDRNTMESLFTHLLLSASFTKAQVVSMDLYRIKKSMQYALYAASAAFLRARSIDDEIKKYEKINFNPEQIENLKRQRELYYNLTIKLVDLSEDKCIDGLQLSVESLIELGKYDKATSILNENKDTTFSANMITFYRLMIKCLEGRKEGENDEIQIANFALKVIEEINSDSIDEWRLIILYHNDPNQIIDKYIEKYRGAFLAKIELELKHILNKNDLENHEKQFYQLVLDYSNKYANKSFIFDDLLPYFASNSSNLTDTSTPVLSTISILSKNRNKYFISVITDEMKSKLIDILKNSNDFSIRSFALGNFAVSDIETQFMNNLKIDTEIKNNKILPIYLEYKIHQYDQTKDLNNLYQPISLFFYLNGKHTSDDKHASPLKIINHQLNFEYENSILNKEIMAILLRSSGILGLTQFQRDLFFAALRVDNAQILSLSPMIVPDFIKNWDLLLLCEYQRRANEFTRLSLHMIMTLMTTTLGFNRKNFFASFDLIQLKKDLEMNEVSYFFILLRFLINGAVSIDINNDIDPLFTKSENTNELLPADPGCSKIDNFNFKKVVPYQKEIVDRYYGKYDTSIYPIYFDSKELQQTLLPTKDLKSDMTIMHRLLFDLNFAVNLIFILKFEMDKIALASISHNQSSNSKITGSDNALNDILNFSDNNDLLDKNWAVVTDFVKNNNLNLYNSLDSKSSGDDHFELSLIQILTLVAVAKISNKEMKSEVAKIVEKEGQKVINSFNKLIESEVPSSLNDDFVDIEVVKNWKNTTGKELFEKQIKAVNYTIDHLKAALST